jgi:hypothetical protein
MTFIRLILALTCLLSGTLAAQEAKVTQLLSKDLTDLPGKEGLMITVEYPLGSSDPIHRHNAHAFIYVLEGSIVMQVRGGKEIILTLVRLSMRVPMMFTSLGGTQAKRNRRNSSCFS